MKEGRRNPDPQGSKSPDLDPQFRKQRKIFKKKKTRLDGADRGASGPLQQQYQSQGVHLPTQEQRNTEVRL